MKQCTYFAGWLTALLLGFVFGVPSAAAQNVVAYRGAAIETVGKAGRIEKGVVLIRDGKIEAVGETVDIPDTARVIDAQGDTIMPGIVDPYHVVPVGRSASATTRTIVINGITFRLSGRTTTTSTVFVRVADGFDPTLVRWGTAVRSGITTANLVTQGYGQSARAAITPADPASILTEPDGHLFLALTNRSSSLDVLRNGLRATPTRRSSASRPTASTTGGASRTAPAAASRPTPSRASSTASPTRALWQKVREGKQPLVVNVNNAATILHLVKALEAQKAAQVIMVSTGPNIFQALDSLKGSKISVILRPQIDLVPNSADRVNMARLADAAKIRFAFSLSLSSGYTQSQDTPLFQLAMLVRAGLARDKALQALTLTPATMLGIDKQVGSVEAGKAANLIICDGDPFATATRFRQVLVDGRPVYEG